MTYLVSQTRLILPMLEITGNRKKHSDTNSAILSLPLLRTLEEIVAVVSRRHVLALHRQNMPAHLDRSSVGSGTRL